MSRINLEDSMVDIVTKMSEGNPGAISVCTKFLQCAQQVDPDNMFGGVGPIMMLDTYGMYGSKIWMLYKDVCNENIAHTIGMIRATQLGIVDVRNLNYAINNRGRGIDVKEIMSKVNHKLPLFDINYPT
jgi:hypothetical protein